MIPVRYHNTEQVCLKFKIALAAGTGKLWAAEHTGIVSWRSLLRIALQLKCHSSECGQACPS